MVEAFLIILFVALLIGDDEATLGIGLIVFLIMILILVSVGYSTLYGV